MLGWLIADDPTCALLREVLKANGVALVYAPRANPGEDRAQALGRSGNLWAIHSASARAVRLFMAGSRQAATFIEAEKRRFEALDGDGRACARLLDLKGCWGYGFLSVAVEPVVGGGGTTCVFAIAREGGGEARTQEAAQVLSLSSARVAGRSPDL